MRALTFRLFTLVMVFLMCLSLIRFAFGLSEPMTFTGFIRALSMIDFSFSSTYQSVIEIVNGFSFPSGGIQAVFEAMKSIIRLISLPITALKDVFTALASVFTFVFRFFGFIP